MEVVQPYVMILMVANRVQMEQSTLTVLQVNITENKSYTVMLLTSLEYLKTIIAMLRTCHHLECDYGYWGQNCEENCSPYCKSGTTCDTSTGTCLEGCEALTVLGTWHVGANCGIEVR